jgi:hypothetical protein
MYPPKTNKKESKLPDFLLQILKEIKIELTSSSLNEEQYLKGKIEGLKMLAGVIDPNSLELIDNFLKEK